MKKASLFALAWLGVLTFKVLGNEDELPDLSKSLSQSAVILKDSGQKGNENSKKTNDKVTQDDLEIPDDSKKSDLDSTKDASADELPNLEGLDSTQMGDSDNKNSTTPAPKEDTIQLPTENFSQTDEKEVIITGPGVNRFEREKVKEKEEKAKEKKAKEKAKEKEAKAKAKKEKKEQEERAKKEKKEADAAAKEAADKQKAGDQKAGDGSSQAEDSLKMKELPVDSADSAQEPQADQANQPAGADKSADKNADKTNPQSPQADAKKADGDEDEYLDDSVYLDDSAYPDEKNKNAQASEDKKDSKADKNNDGKNPGDKADKALKAPKVQLEESNQTSKGESKEIKFIQEDFYELDTDDFTLERDEDDYIFRVASLDLEAFVNGQTYNDKNQIQTFGVNDNFTEILSKDGKIQEYKFFQKKSAKNTILNTMRMPLEKVDFNTYKIVTDSFSLPKYFDATACKVIIKKELSATLNQNKEVIMDLDIRRELRNTTDFTLFLECPR